MKRPKKIFIVLFHRTVQSHEAGAPFASNPNIKMEIKVEVGPYVRDPMSQACREATAIREKNGLLPMGMWSVKDVTEVKP